MMFAGINGIEIISKPLNTGLLFIRNFTAKCREKIGSGRKYYKEIKIGTNYYFDPFTRPVNGLFWRFHHKWHGSRNVATRHKA